MADNTTAYVSLYPHSKLWIEGVTIPIIGVCGIFGNLLALAVLLSKKLQIVGSIRNLLTLLTTFDTLLVSSHLFITWPGHWSDSIRSNFE